MDNAKGVVRTKDGISSCESHYDLYAYVRRPDIARPLQPQVVAKKTKSLKSEIKDKINSQSTYHLVGLILKVFIFPLILVFYLIPKWIVTLIFSIFQLLIKIIKAVAAKLKSGLIHAYKLVEPIINYFIRVKSRIYAFLSRCQVRLIKNPLNFLQKCKRFFKKSNTNTTHPSKAFRIKQAIGQLHQNIQKTRKQLADYRLKIRIFLLKAPFKLFDWIENKLEVLESYKNRMFLKIKQIYNKIFYWPNRFFEFIEIQLIKCVNKLIRLFRFNALKTFLTKTRNKISSINEGLNRKIENVIDRLKQGIVKFFKLFSIRSLINRGSVRFTKYTSFNLGLKNRVASGFSRVVKNIRSIKLTIPFNKKFSSLPKLSLNSLYPKNLKFLGNMRFIVDPFTKGFNGVQKLVQKSAFKIYKSILWGVALIELGLEHTQQLAIDLDRKFPVGAFLEKFI